MVVGIFWAGCHCFLGGSLALALGLRCSCFFYFAGMSARERPEI